MKKRVLPVLLPLALALTALVALAAERPDVVLGGKVILTFRASAGGKTPLQRAIIVTKRCVDILSDQGVTEKDVRIVTAKKGAEPQIYAGKYLFVTVTRADAEANKTDMQALAKVWAKNFAAGLAIARIRPQQEPQ
jgi:hypothetical protein